MNTINTIYIYRYKITDWDELENQTCVNTGFVAGSNYSDAVSRLEKITTAPGQNHSTLIEINLYEIDSYDGDGVLDDSTIVDIYEEEKNNA